MSVFEPEDSDSTQGRWRLAIQHETSLRYDGAARASYNELRMTPLDTAAQTTLATRVELSPQAPQWQYTDYWGTRVTSFDLQEPHEALTIRAVSVVETSPPMRAGGVGGAGESADTSESDWAEIRRKAASGDLAEFTTSTGCTRIERGLRSELAERVESCDPHTAAGRICGWIHQAMAYVPGATGVQTSGQEAWESRSGVCQDFSHIAIGMLRAAGLPARYVSGYLFPVEDPAPGVTCEGQSHAWTEYWTGGAWYGIDATNDVTPGLRHVVVGYGREYGDVVPHKGIYLGAPESTLTVSVKLTRLG